MLKISLDEAYVFDLLSIYEVKISNSVGKKRETLIKTFSKLMDEIQKQIGIEKYNEIINSLEYLELKLLNEKVFRLVDRSEESVLSKITAQANYDRYLKKIDLQNKFFNNELDEVKI